MLTGIDPVVELPELNTPLVTSEVNWIYDPSPCISEMTNKFDICVREHPIRTKLPASLPPAQRNNWYDWSWVIGGEVPDSFHAICSNSPPTAEAPAEGDVNSTSANA